MGESSVREPHAAPAGAFSNFSVEVLGLSAVLMKAVLGVEYMFYVALTVWIYYLNACILCIVL